MDMPLFTLFLLLAMICFVLAGFSIPVGPATHRFSMRDFGFTFLVAFLITTH